MAERIDIGIDGGGTGCRVAIAVAGQPVAEQKGGPANIVTDPAGAEASIRETVYQTLADLGLSPEDLQNARICAGLAGARLPGAADAFANRLPMLAYVVDDSVTALEGAFDGADGTLASLGTGSFFIRKAHGTVRHIGGWGFHLGDEGSAAWLGRRALSRALKTQDGRLPPDPLADALMSAADPHPVLFAGSAKPGDYAQIAKLVLDHADTPLASALLDEVVAELRAGLEDLSHAPGAPWVLTGGLGDLLADHLPPDLAMGRQGALGRPLDGALRLARALP